MRLRCPSCSSTTIADVMSFRCACGQSLRLPVAASGKRLRCPTCSKTHVDPKAEVTCECGRRLRVPRPPLTPTPPDPKLPSHPFSQVPDRSTTGAEPPDLAEKQRRDVTPSRRSPTRPITSPVPQRMPPITIPPIATSASTLCPCGCGRPLRFHVRGAGAGYRRARDAAAQLEAIRLTLGSDPEFTAEDDRTLHGSVTRCLTLCGSWLEHCHRTARPGRTPDMLALSELTVAMEDLARG